MPSYRILQLIPQMETGGAERTTIDIAAALQARGCISFVASGGGRLVKPLEDIGAKHIPMPLEHKNPWHLWQNSRQIARLIRRYDINLIHARSRAPAWSALLAARSCKIPLVTTYHGIYGETNRFKSFYNSVMARGDYVIANSHFTAAAIRARYQHLKPHIDIIYRGIDVAGFDTEKISPARRERLLHNWGLHDWGLAERLDGGGPQKIILNVGRLTRWKGQDILLQALAQLARERTDFLAILAGDAQRHDNFRDELKAQINALGLGARVFLVGNCDDVPAALALSDIAVVASTQAEAFGRAAVEAQAARTPIIATDIGAARETVCIPQDSPQSQRSGWRVPPGDPQALAKCLDALMSMPAQSLNSVTDFAYHEAHRRFSLAAMQQSTLQLYDKALQNWTLR